MCPRGTVWMNLLYGRASVVASWGVCCSSQRRRIEKRRGHRWGERPHRGGEGVHRGSRGGDNTRR